MNNIRFSGLLSLKTLRTLRYHFAHNTWMQPFFSVLVLAAIISEYIPNKKRNITSIYDLIEQKTMRPFDLFLFTNRQAHFIPFKSCSAPFVFKEFQNRTMKCSPCLDDPPIKRNNLFVCSRFRPRQPNA